jgi:outer membrane protein
MRLIYKLSIALLLLPVVAMQGQNSGKITSDSLSLSEIINAVISNHPALKKAEKDMNTADAKIGLTKTAFLPDVNFSTSFTFLGPTTSLTMPGLGSFELYPPDNYSAAVTVNQSIYDFGKTDKNVALDHKNKEILQLSTEQIKQRLSTAVMGGFYTINFLQQAIIIKDDQLKNLNEHLQFIQKKVDTGSATKYDVLTTKVRISTIENQKTDLQTALQVQISQLNSLMGKPQENPIVIKNEIQAPKSIASADSLCTAAYANRSELKMARQKEEIAKSRLEVIKVQNNPSLNAYASGGFKNGYFNNKFEDVGKFNFAVGVGLKVPIFDANRSKYLKTMANSDLEGNQQETELARRNITTEVVECRANAEASLKKIKQSELQVLQASQAYELADVNYKAGGITNLDLLDSYTALSESKLVLFKTKIDYTISLQRLKIALGEQIY